MSKRAFYVGIGAAILGAALAFSAQAADKVRLCGGPQGGGYEATMQGVATELQRQGLDVTVVSTGGSEDNLNALAAGTCDYAPAQKDVHYLMSKSNGKVAGLSPVSLLYNEVITMMCSRSSGYDELSDLKKGDSIVVGTIGSGSALTWDTLVAVEKEFGNKSGWINATPVYTPLDEAAAAISIGQAKCAIGVGSLPIGWATSMQKQGFTVSWVYDKDLSDLKFAGSSLYEYVRVPSGPYASKFDTYKVPAVLFRSPSFKGELADRVVKRVAPSIGAKRNTVD